MVVLRELIADRIRTSGAISFAEFMELSLYHPEFGYYARAAQKTGRAGDFFTSVDVGALFGELLAKQFAEMWRLLSGSDPRTGTGVRPHFDLVEAGAGNGRLSRDVLDAAQRSDPEFYSAIRLSLVELSPTARAAQSETLGPHAPLLKHSGVAMREAIHGVIFVNELLDVLPTHAVAMTGNGLREGLVERVDDRLVESLREPLTPRLAEYLARAGAVMHKGTRAEVNLAAEDWMKRACTCLSKGFMVIIDYGHEEAALYGGSHATGTLTSFKRHTQVADFLQAPGECDITAHVDLTAVTRRAERAGLQVLGRLDQTYFMLGLGTAELPSMSFQQRLAMK